MYLPRTDVTGESLIATGGRRGAGEFAVYVGYMMAEDRVSIVQVQNDIRIELIADLRG
jgi:hypothetical protein